jgi:pilus assembly protein CpaB
MKSKAIIPLVLGLVVGLFAVKFGVDAIRKAQASNTQKATFAAVRAKQDISSHVAITKDMVEIVQTSDEQFAPMKERFDSLEKVVNRVTAKGIPASAPILASMLAPPDARPGMIGRIPPGYRAQSVKISEDTAVGYQLQPGNMVDVIAIMDIDMGGRKKERVSEAILENVQIAAIGLMQTGDQAASTSGKVKPAKSATLLVPMADSPLLHWANKEGEITLALRGDEETREGVKKKGGVLLAAFERAQGGLPYAPPAPVLSPSPTDDTGSEQLVSVPLPHEVVLYKGNQVEHITFLNESSSQIINQSNGGRPGGRSPIVPRASTPQRAPSSAAPAKIAPAQQTKHESPAQPAPEEDPLEENGGPKPE